MTAQDEKNKEAMTKAGMGGDVPMARVAYDNTNMLDANIVTITFNLENVSRMKGGIGVDFILGRMERIRNDLAAIILDKQDKRAQLANPAGPIKIVN